MKQQAVQYLALDVHQATTVATVRKENDAISTRATVATEANAILNLVRCLGGRVHVVFEEDDLLVLRDEGSEVSLTKNVCPDDVAFEHF